MNESGHTEFLTPLVTCAPRVLSGLQRHVEAALSGGHGSALADPATWFSEVDVAAPLPAAVHGRSHLLQRCAYSASPLRWGTEVVCSFCYCD